MAQYSPRTTTVRGLALGVAFERAVQLEASYEDLELGLGDANVMALCERLEEDKVPTLDRRDFSVVRTSSGGALRLLAE